MARVVRSKHVLREMMEDDYSLPKENQKIVRIVCSRGNNLHEVETPDSSKFLVSMPCKFRRNIWVKRGDFLLVDPIAEGDKVKAEIVKKLMPEHIKEFTKAGIWPKAFTKKREHKSDDDDDFPNEDDNGLLVRNKNRPMHYYPGDNNDDGDTTDSSNTSNDE